MASFSYNPNLHENKFTNIFGLPQQHDMIPKTYIYQIISTIPLLINPHKHSPKNSLNGQDRNVNKPLSTFKE